ncbi:MarR family transcriptional regulator [Nocardia sp. CDC186]|uniref:MarR family transcriptional regulator n=1 Tax=Nocardia implantans TaxID=3108168 RepID=A0ABU6ANJ3_9NOCA|nr:MULTISPECIES: MarR family transcriptional regulator [unclassified Nocardia]MBF6192199.1 MarR family transcriptional regulator [Nocardia beijingensis]MEA3530950.1 MarR family transcriptional regulator [Nocardia sp. CDC192]MEB3509040.1 MarR family transcriptional regulator [Nocardia sp. CDC186]
MENAPARLTAKPSWLLTQLAVHAHRLASDSFAEAGARGYHFRILAALEEFGAASQADLGRRCNMDRSDVVAAINELAGPGFVERTPDPDDRRRNIVTLTEAGERQLRRIDRALDKAQDDLLGPLSAEDRADLTRLLARLLAHHQRG